VLEDGGLHAGGDTAEEDECVDFPWNGEEADSTVVSTLKAGVLLEDGDHDCILPIVGIAIGRMQS